MRSTLEWSRSYLLLHSLLVVSALGASACGDGAASPLGSDATPSPMASAPPSDGRAEGSGAGSGMPASGADAVVGQRHLSAIGMQLYTVRALMQTDFEGTLRKLADMGYREVEFAGLFGHDPAQVRQLLAELQLTAVGSHVDWTRFRDNPAGAIEETLQLGAGYLVFPWLPDSEHMTINQWHGWAARLNEVGALSHERGLPVAYHNHDFEFAAIDGTRPYDVLLDELDPSLVRFELDLYWVAKGGGDPSALFERNPGAFPLGHVKDLRRSDQAIVDVGQGDLDFGAIFAQAQQSGMQHYIVEHDDPSDPLQTAQNSITYLKQLAF